MRGIHDTRSEEAIVETALVREDRERRRKVHAQAKLWLQHFGSLVRQLGVHDAMNTAVQAVLDPLLDSLRHLSEERHAVTFVFAGGHSFCDGVWVRCTGRAWETAGLIAQQLERMGARGFATEAEADASTLLALARAIRDTSRRPRGAPVTPIGEMQIPGLRFLPVEEERDDDTARSKFRRQAFELLDEGLRTTDRAAQAKMDIFTRRRQRSLVLRLVQLAEESPEDLLLLTTLRDPSLPATAHIVMVTILAIALGRMMDLRRRDLVRLGIAALSHNVGETALPVELLSNARELTPEERVRLESHPLAGARLLLDRYGVEPQIAERALASIEHHRWVDGGGYPRLVRHESHAFARIIAVADVFDALCQARPFRESYPPDQAIKLVGRFAGAHLDPVLVRTLLRMVGKFPPGALVELDTGEYALVLGPGRGAQPLNRPRVLLLTDDEGYELDTFLVVDLGERHPRRRAWMRTVMRARDPRRLGQPVSAYLLADRVEKPPERLDLDVETRTTQVPGTRDA